MDAAGNIDRARVKGRTWARPRGAANRFRATIVSLARLNSGLRRASMSKPISLVLYGRKQRLLDTRRRLLQEAGYQVWTAGQIPDVFSIITEERIDVLILCHTLSPEECEWALAFADVQSPPMKSIVLSARES